MKELINRHHSKLINYADEHNSRLKKEDIIPTTLEMARIRRNRMTRIEDKFHKTSKFLIDYCLKHQIGRIAIGYIPHWKSGLALGRGTQDFVYVPFVRLLKKIEYKGQLVGIEVIRIPESHTSKSSALDRESIEHHDSYMGVRGSSMKGLEKRAKGGTPKYYKARGLFKTNGGKYIHSDVNASFNIGRRAFGSLYETK